MADKNMAEIQKDSLFKEIERHIHSIYVLQDELEVMVPQHTHTQGHILVVLDGVATINVERSAYYIPNGYFVWLPPHISHRISFEEKKIKLLNIYYPPQFADETFYQHVGVYPIPSLLYHTIEVVKEETADYQENDWRYQLMATMNRILPYILKADKFKLRLPTSDHPIIQKIVTCIHQGYQTPLTAQSVSREAGLSVRTLSRYLRSELNTTFIQYLQTYRIIMAIRLLVKGENSISDIAYNVGYDSLTAFSNTFYKITGCRPSQFLNRNEH